jgi:hypothetical protein
LITLPAISSVAVDTIWFCSVFIAYKKPSLYCHRDSIANFMPTEIQTVEA